MKKIRQHLGWKLFFSYLIVVLAGFVSLAISAEFHAPTALERHVANMGMMMDGTVSDLTTSFRTAVNETLLVAVTIATVTSVAVSSLVTRRIVSPVRRMKEASQRIAEGRYDERVKAAGEDELADLARSFNQMALQLSQTEERRRQLIGDVAHELRTPLSSIKSVMEGLQDGVLPAEPSTFLNVQHELNRLQRLVHDLEELSRAEAGQIPLELEATHPAAFIQTAAERLRLQFEDKGVTLHLDLVDNLPPVWVDVARMIQVMLNLLGNALQYTPSGGQVAVSARAKSDKVIISVQDSGIGILPEQLQHIFERFYRVDQSRSRTGGGSGVGLTISKHLVEMHHGYLTAASSGPNRGSTFTITLPVTKRPVSQDSG